MHTPSKRKSYHPNIIFAEQLGILDKDIKISISASTRHYFRKRDLSKMVGFDIQKNEIELIKQFAKNKKAIQIFRTILNIKNFLLKIQSSIHAAKSDLIKDITSINLKKKIITIILKSKKVLSFERVIKYFSISKETYYSWIKEITYQCHQSHIGRCFKKCPHQLTSNELKKMKQLLSDLKYDHWPVVSVAYYALRNNIVSASKSTWYKYAKILGIKRKLPENRRKKSDIGIRAEKPNQIWHSDITQFSFPDNTKTYIYLVTDNYSRKILSYIINNKVSSETQLNLIQKTYETYEKCQNNSSIQLVTDGGPENKSLCLKEYVNQKNIKIEHIIAQKDIRFSNSLSESVNKILKYGYFYRSQIKNNQSLEKFMPIFMKDYITSRPHGSLNGLTPDEAFSGEIHTKIEYSGKIQKAIRKRIQENRKNRCIEMSNIN